MDVLNSVQIILQCMIHDSEENDEAGASGLEQRNKVYFHFLSKRIKKQWIVFQPSSSRAPRQQANTHKIVMMAATQSHHQKRKSITLNRIIPP